MVKPSPGWPVLLVAESQVPLTNGVSCVVSFLEFIRQCEEAGVQPIGDSRFDDAIVKTGVNWVPRKGAKLSFLFTNCGN